MELSKSLLQITQISENLQNKFLMLNLMNNHGSELNKNIFFSKHKIAFQLDLTDGQVLDSQEFRDHTIAQ
jgi:hypothetical protein